jgi:hypothetical protein
VVFLLESIFIPPGATNFWVPELELESKFHKDKPEQQFEV